MDAAVTAAVTADVTPDTRTTPKLTQPQKLKAMLKSIPWGGIFALMGGFLIQLCLGSFYSFGNMMTYMTSYMRVNGSPNLTYTDFVVVQSVWGMTQGTIMPISGFLIRYIGPRTAMFSGCIIFSIGTALTHLTINTNLPLVGLTYGFVQAFGQSIALIPTMTIGMRWFPKRKGMAMGIVVGGFGGGSFIFNLIQTALVNPNNVSIDESGYFTNPDVIDRVPNLLLTLAAIYVSIQMVACFMVTEPRGCNVPHPELGEAVDSSTNSICSANKGNENEEEKTQQVEALPDKDLSVSPKHAFKRKELYILWLTRFCVVLVTQAVAAFYKAFGQSFISDDHFLALVGSVCSIFNCSGRLFYGLLMDKTTYRTAMTTETVLLTIFTATFFFTSNGGKAMYAIWVWMIFFTFPGTYSTQPAVTTQTFGHKHGGTIYGFLFTSDIVNNLLVGFLSKPIKEAFGWLGLFVSISVFAAFAFVITRFFPSDPGEETRKHILRQIQEHHDDQQAQEGNKTKSTEQSSATTASKTLSTALDALSSPTKKKPLLDEQPQVQTST